MVASRAAVAHEAGKPLSIETIDIEGPREGELLIEIKATGICHTDAYTLSGADPEGLFPSVLGHEGAGIVVETGAGVTSVKPGDHVVVEHPNYPSLYEVPRSLGCDVTLFRLRRENAFKPDWDELERLITPKTKLISLTHPNNPTGSMIDAAEFERAVSIAESYGVYLLFDETYRELSYGEQLPGAGASSPHVISLSSMSKSYGLPGIRIGWLATRSAEVRDAVLAIREQVTITNSALGEQIAFSVLKRKTEFIDRVRTHVQQNFEIVRTWMATQEALDWIEPGAGVVGFPWIVDSCIDPEEIYTRLVKEYRSFVIPGRCFEMDNAHFRLGYGGANDELQIGLVNIGNAIADSLE